MSFVNLTSDTDEMRDEMVEFPKIVIRFHHLPSRALRRLVRTVELLAQFTVKGHSGNDQPPIIKACLLLEI